METTNLWGRHDTADTRWLDGPRFWRVLPERQMRSAVMIIGPERFEVAPKAAFVEHDHVIQTLSADGSDQASNVCPLPWRPRSGQHVLDAHRLDLFNELVAEDAIAVAQEIAGRARPWEGFPEPDVPSTPHSDEPTAISTSATGTVISPVMVVSRSRPFVTSPSCPASAGLKAHLAAPVSTSIENGPRPLIIVCTTMNPFMLLSGSPTPL